MNIHEAIATGKRYKRSSIGMAWRSGPLVACLHIVKGVNHPARSLPYCNLATQYEEGVTGLRGLWVESFHANDWIVEDDGEHFEYEARDILSKLGCRLETSIKRKA